MTARSPGRVVGIDYGLKRIGLAVSDPGRRFASPVETLAAPAGCTACVAAVMRRAAEYAPTAYVVGLPLNMDGSDSEQTRITRRFAAALAKAVSVPVHLQDERLSSFAADQVLAAAGVSGRRQRKLRDALAAQAILRAFLSSEQNPPGDPLPAR